MLAWLEPTLRATQTSDVQSVFFKEKPNKLKELMDNTGSRVFPTLNQSHFFHQFSILCWPKSTAKTRITGSHQQPNDGPRILVGSRLSCSFIHFRNYFLRSSVTKNRYRIY